MLYCYSSLIKSNHFTTWHYALANAGYERIFTMQQAIFKRERERGRGDIDIFTEDIQMKQTVAACLTCKHTTLN